MIQKKLNIVLYCFFFLTTTLLSCNTTTTNCEKIQEWKALNYRIIKSKCPDLVLANYFKYEVYIGDKKQNTGASQIDSCIFTFQATSESFLTLNTCDNTIKEFNPHKIYLDTKSIDSIIIFSKKENKAKPLTPDQIGKFAIDWNNSKVRGHSSEPFDSAFSFFPSYQYKLTVFFKEKKQHFYGYNYLILDSSNWKHEMSTTGDLEYFNNFWKK